MGGHSITLEMSALIESVFYPKRSGYAGDHKDNKCGDFQSPTNALNYLSCKCCKISYQNRVADCILQLVVLRFRDSFPGGDSLDDNA
jgi:hypothetical protein